MDTRKEYEDVMAVLHHQTPDNLPDFGNSAAFPRAFACTRTLNALDGYFYDPFGVKFKMTSLGLMPDNTTTRKFELTDVTEWEKMMPKINLDEVDWENFTARMLDNIRSVNGNNTQHLVYNCFVGYLWDELQYMMGFEEALYSVAAEPEATRDFLSAIADFAIASFERQCQYFKPEIGAIMDHVANSKGLLMSPESYRQVVKPAEKKIIEALKGMDIQTEIHCDGLIEDILPDYAEMGVEIIQPFQVFNDIQAAKEKYGFIAVGGWDAFGPGNMEEATEEVARQSVRTAMDAYGGGGGYLFWNSGVLNDGTKKKEWIIDEAYKYGRGFYKK